VSKLLAGVGDGVKTFFAFVAMLVSAGSCLIGAISAGGADVATADVIAGAVAWIGLGLAVFVVAVLIKLYSAPPAKAA